MKTSSTPIQPTPIRLAVGHRVDHAMHGQGVVAKVLDGGRMVLVRFDKQPAIPRVLPLRLVRPTSALSAFSPAPSSPARPAPARPAPVRPAPSAASRRPAPGLDGGSSPDRQTLEALRMGVAPANGLDALTVGRHEEQARLSVLLDAGHGMLVLSGGYGTGKTHMIELTEAAALRRGFVVARATFDPVEVPPSHPLRLYGALMRDLRLPGGADRGLAALLYGVGDSEAHIHGKQAHRWLSPAIFALHHADSDLAQDVVEYVSGQARDDHRALWRSLRRLGFQGPPMLGLPDYRTFGQIMAHLLGGVAAWSTDAGYKGLVVLLDEAEYLDQLSSVSRDMAQNVLRYLAVAALPPPMLAFSPDAIYKGGQAAHRRIPARFVDDQPLSVVCAFTPNPQVDRVLRQTLADPAAILALNPVRPSLFPVLAEKVYGLIKIVHPQLDPAPEHRVRVTRVLDGAFRSGQIESTRQAARLVVEFWDLYRLSPVRALAALHNSA